MSARIPFGTVLRYPRHDVVTGERLRLSSRHETIRVMVIDCVPYDDHAGYATGTVLHLANVDRRLRDRVGEIHQVSGYEIVDDD